LKRFRSVVYVGAVVLSGLGPVQSQAAELRIGVVNAVRVLEASPQAEEAKKRMEKEFSSRESKLRNQQNELKRKEDKMAKDDASMPDSERRTLEKDILSIRRELKRDQDEFREDVNIRRNEEFSKIQRQVAEAIQSVAKEDGYDLVLGEGVMFASPRIDVTDKVVERLKRGTK
jgi:outer membrane protein